MDDAALRQLLDQLAASEVDADEVVRRLRRLPFAELGYAMVDHHRELRQGLPEAVYGPGKSPDHCVGIVGELLSAGDEGRSAGCVPERSAGCVPERSAGWVPERSGGPVVLSRANEEQIAAVVAAFPGSVVTGSTVVWRPAPPREEAVLVLTAGTADLEVAEECRATLRAFGFGAALVADVGVAGLHRLLVHLDLVQAADAVVVVAGMEGALASVAGGLTAAPVVAVPTSVGYGASLEGVTALLSMMASCASGVVVVGIDNGFGAAHAVARMLGPAAAPSSSPAGSGASANPAATDPAATGPASGRRAGEAAR